MKNSADRGGRRVLSTEVESQGGLTPFEICRILHILRKPNSITVLLLNFQPRIMHFQQSDCFTQSRLSAHIPQSDLIWKTKKFLSGRGAKKVDFASFLPTKQQEKKENAIPAATRKPQTLVRNYLMVLRSFLTNLKKL